MKEKSTTSTSPDRDDPPRFTREMAERGRHMIGDKVIREARPRGRPAGSVAAVTKQQVTLRLDRDIVEIFKAAGAGWQTRINEALREAVKPSE
jgi:uncharacterized protein (DUF4415 family)